MNTPNYETDITLQGKDYDSRPTINVTGPGLNRNIENYSDRQLEALFTVAEAQLKIGPVQRLIVKHLKKSILSALPKSATADDKKVAINTGVPSLFARWTQPIDLMDVLDSTIREENRAATIKARLAEIAAQTAGFSSMMAILDDNGKQAMKVAIEKLMAEVAELKTELASL